MLLYRYSFDHDSAPPVLIAIAAVLIIAIMVAFVRSVYRIHWHSRSAAPTTPEEAASITAPVLMLTAENDTIFPPAAIREIAGLIPGAKFRELSGAGHSAYFEIPQTWNAAVLEFLQALALPGPAPDRRV